MLTGRYSFLLKAVITAFIVGALVQYGALNGGALKGAVESPAALGLVIGLLALTYVLASVRWMILLDCQSVRLGFHAAASVTFLTLFMGNFLPGGMATADGVRITYVARSFPERKAAAVMSIFADRLVGLFAMLCVCCAVTLVEPMKIAGSAPMRLLAVGAWTLMALALILIALFFVRSRMLSRVVRKVAAIIPAGSIRSVMTRVLESLLLYRNAPGAMLIALLLSIAGFMIGLVCVAIIGFSMQLGPLTPIEYGFAAPWAWIASLLPLTPGGLGVGEAAFDRICHWREPSHTAAAYGTIFLVYRIAAIVAMGPGLIVYLLHRNTFMLVKRPADER